MVFFPGTFLPGDPKETDIFEMATTLLGVNLGKKIKLTPDSFNWANTIFENMF